MAQTGPPANRDMSQRSGSGGAEVNLVGHTQAESMPHEATEPRRLEKVVFSRMSQTCRVFAEARPASGQIWTL